MDPFNSRFILNEKRWLWIDYDKGISIILVGYGHCFSILQYRGVNLADYPAFNYFGVFFFGFRMPLFFIVSGLLVARSLNKKKLKGYVSDRINNILYPLFVWGFLQVTLQLITAHFTHNTVTPVNYLNLLINPRETEQFWYLNALFFIGVIYAFLRAVVKLTPLMQVALGFILYSISAYLHIHVVSVHIFNTDFGFLTDVFEFYIFFAIGDLISKIALDEKNIQKFSSWKVFVPLLVIFVIIQYYFTELNLRPNPEEAYYVEHKLPFFFLLEALVGCTLSVSFSFLLQKHRTLTFLRIVGFHSLFIYCMQIIVMTIARTVFMSVLHITYVPALVLLVWSSGIILPIFFYNFCLKYNLWWLYTFRKPERQVEYMKATNIFSLKKA